MGGFLGHPQSIPPCQATPDEMMFEEFFRLLTGHKPFPWQVELYRRMVRGEIPQQVSIPTGLGKTAIVAVWLIALANRPDILPRRLVYVVNRRTVVDQTTHEVEQYQKRVQEEPGLAPLRQRLEALCALPPADHPPSLSPNTLQDHPAEHPAPLAISTLRGQWADNRQWLADPARPAVIVGTVDMIGSRLLFSGYRIGFRERPLHAGLLGHDVLLVHDEAHLEPAFQVLLEQIQRTLQQEQERTGGLGVRPFRLMALSATLRANASAPSGQEVFGLSDQERLPLQPIPSDDSHPLACLWRRLRASKRIFLHSVADEEKHLVSQIVEQALRWKQSGLAVLIFVRRVEHVEQIADKLRKKELLVQQLTGTMRGLERDKLVRQDPVFARFLPMDSRPGGVQPVEGTAYLVCTSAGEVGVNLSADHLVCDLTPLESMIQRFGRVNRFGQRSDSEIHVLHPTQFDEADSFDKARQKTLELLGRLGGDGSPAALLDLPRADCADAFSPPPTVLPISEILLDAWSMTSIRDQLPGRPEVEPYLHGLVKEEIPETYVAWREEVEVISTDLLLQRYPPEELLEHYPLKPHELLRDQSDRVWKHLKELANRLRKDARERDRQHPVWLVDSRGAVQVFTLEKLVQQDKSAIYYRTVLLPPSVGGLQGGFLDGQSAPPAGESLDVADQGVTDLVQKKARRLRRFSDNPEPEHLEKMRLIWTIDTQPEAEEAEEVELAGVPGEVSEAPTGQPAVRGRYWHWYESIEAAETEGSESAHRPIPLDEHLEAAAELADRMAERLGLPASIRQAVCLAARLHDLGKRRRIWQQAIGNSDPSQPLAKGPGAMRLAELSSYRHELGSLLDLAGLPEFQSLSEEQKDLVCHLVAAHHGRARPHFPAEAIFDPERPLSEAEAAAWEVPRRFARLQRRFGRWGLAYLEALVKAVDYAVSSHPERFVNPSG
jgi:CRISPR-associated endonuclease/helicase Cas3